MKHMTFRERRYRRAHLDCVRHITLDPKGPGMVRIHMIPPRDDTPDAPFLLLLNGAQLGHPAGQPDGSAASLRGAGSGGG